MLLQCDVCGQQFSALAKIPCGYYIDEYEDGRTVFVQPNDEVAYRNLCLECLLQQQGSN